MPWRYVWPWFVHYFLTKIQIISALHRRFSKTFTPALVFHLSAAISAPSRAMLAALAPEQREKEDSSRVTRQRPILRVCSELALVGIIKDSPERSGAEWIMKAMKELVSPPVIPRNEVILKPCISYLTILVYHLCLCLQHF